MAKWVSKPRNEFKIQVVDGKFQEDPQALAHICVPRNWVKEMAERLVMETLQKFKSLEERGNEKPIYMEMLKSIYDDKSIREYSI